LTFAVRTPSATDGSGVIVHGNVLSELVHVTSGRLPVNFTDKSHTTGAWRTERRVTQRHERLWRVG